MFSHVIICITPRSMRTINTFLMVPHLEKEKANITLFLSFFPARQAHIFPREYRTRVEPVYWYPGQVGGDNCVFSPAPQPGLCRYFNVQEKFWILSQPHVSHHALSCRETALHCLSTPSALVT